MRPVTVAVFNSPTEAELLQARLKSAGIEAELRSESNVELLGEFSRPCAGMRVQVARADFEAALKLVYDWNAKSDATPAAFSPSVYEAAPSWKVTRRDLHR